MITLLHSRSGELVAERRERWRILRRLLLFLVLSTSLWWYGETVKPRLTVGGISQAGQVLGVSNRQVSLSLSLSG